jgi:hypothetical protein
LNIWMHCLNTEDGALLSMEVWQNDEGRGFKCHTLLVVQSVEGHCATCRKVAVSIPDDVIGIFHWHNPSGCTMSQGSTHPLTEMSTRNISWE